MQLVEKEALIVVGMPVRATWDDLWTEMPNAWQQFIDRHQEIAHTVGETFLDVSLEQNGHEYLQLIGREVSHVAAVPEDMLAVQIPAQPYIYHRHRGATGDIAASFGTMYDWARQQGHDASSFKLDIGYTTSGTEHQHDLFVGLLPEVSWHELPAPATDDISAPPLIRRS